MEKNKKWYIKATNDNKPLQLQRHKQLTPLWNRFFQFFIRPKFTKSNFIGMSNREFINYMKIKGKEQDDKDCAMMLKNGFSTYYTKK